MSLEIKKDVIPAIYTRLEFSIENFTIMDLTLNIFSTQQIKEFMNVMF